MDALTKVCTLLIERGFALVPPLTKQDVTAVYLMPRFQQDAKRLSNKDDFASVLAKAKNLQRDGLDRVKNLNFCTFPMKARSGLFELRYNGTRLYGSRVYNSNTSEVVVMTGAEHKGGKIKADPTLLDTCEKIHVDLMKEIALIIESNDIERQKTKKQFSRRKGR